MCPLSEIKRRRRRIKKSYHKKYIYIYEYHWDPYIFLPVRLQKEVYIQWDYRGYTRCMCHIMNMVFEGTESLVMLVVESNNDCFKNLLTAL